MLGNGTSVRRRPRVVVLTGVCTAIFVCFTLFFVIASRSIGGFGSWPPAWLSAAHGNGAGSHLPLDELDIPDDDGFTLHPEQHIFRAPHTIRLHWNITREARRPDGVLKDVYLINGHFPGPTIEARSGDAVEVTVTNGIAGNADSGLAIHWHGMLMKGANEMDGVVGVTQCIVTQGQTFTYKFQIDEEQHGTFWYHSHSAVQRADGLYGGLVVHRPVNLEAQSDLSLYEYDRERLLLVGDWYHWTAGNVLDGYKNFRNFAYEPAPDSLLVNGVGSYNCSNARPGKPIDCVETDVPAVKLSGKATRLRLVNTGASAGYSVQLDRAKFQLISVDGGGFTSDSTPQTSTIGVLYPGERMDVLLLPEMATRQSGQPDAEAIKIVLDLELMQLMNPALTRIQSFPLEIPATASHFGRKDSRENVEILDMKNVQGPSLPEGSAVGKAPAEIALLYTSLGISSFRNDEPWGEVNHTSWVWKDPKAKPLLAIDRTLWENGTQQANPLRKFSVPRYEAGPERWLELVVNNVDDKGHPFHLHGYEFYVVGSRQREFGRPYNPFAEDPETEPVNTLTPLRKDTVYIRPRGYVILRFRLDNPGLWLMHCHVLWHQAAGMGVILQVGDVADATARRAEQSCASVNDDV